MSIDRCLYACLALVYNGNTARRSENRGLFFCNIVVFVICVNLRFDVEKECSKIDESSEENNSKARFSIRPSLPLIEKKINTTGNVLEAYFLIFIDCSTLLSNVNTNQIVL